MEKLWTRASDMAHAPSVIGFRLACRPYGWRKLIARDRQGDRARRVVHAPASCVSRRLILDGSSGGLIRPTEVSDGREGACKEGNAVGQEPHRDRQGVQGI